MRADDFEDRGNFFIGEAELPKQVGCLGYGVSNVIPRSECSRLLRAVADKDSQVVHPGRGKKHVVIKRPAFRKLRGEMIEPRLVAEFVRRDGIGADVIDYQRAAGGLVHAGKLAGWVVEGD